MCSTLSDTLRQPVYRCAFSVLMTLALFGLTFVTGVRPAHMQGTQTPGSNLAQQANNQAFFTDLTFGATGDGPAVTYFPVGTQQVFARWTFANVPTGAGVTLLRQWYRNGQLFIQKQETWNLTWGSNGRLTHISIFDFNAGLTPGYYHVIMSLMYDYPAAQVTGDFVIADYPSTVVAQSAGASFTDLTVSSSAGGAAMTGFPAGTPIVSARWNYLNVPIGAVVQRDWYLNGVLFRSLQEPWSPYWGTSGRLTHIAIYDYERGLASGNYRVNIFLRDTPAVQASATFVIGAVPSNSAVFSGLSFSTSQNGPATGIFPHGTQQVFARWNFQNISPESRIVRRWFRNGVPWLQREDAWTYGINGTVRDVSIFDFQYGLLPGDYYVEISLVGMPNSLLRGYFTIY